MANALSAEILDRSNRQSQRLRELLHAPEILVMPGADTTLSALLFEALGFKAIQGSSGGIAAVQGWQDGEILPRTEAVEVYRQMTAVVQVPVNADGEKGYGGPEEVAETVRQLIGAGVAGMNLEDGGHHGPGEPVRLVPRDRQLEKIAAVMATRAALGSTFFLNARVDAYLTADPPERKLAEAIDRGNAYAEGGADCIFYIGVSDSEVIRALVREIKAPVSILANPSCPSVQALEDMGVARVSYGTAFTRLAAASMRDLAEVLLAKGDPAPLLQRAVPTPDLARLLRGRPPA